MSLKQVTVEEVAQHNKAGDLWIIIDSVVYDLSKFGKLHPGGLGVLVDPDVGEWTDASLALTEAGKDATTVFFSLHRQEVLLKPQYQRLRVAQIAGQSPRIRVPKPDDLSRVPYAEPAWLAPGFKSPYYNDSHRRLQKGECEPVLG
jgi:cytochrome b involved in lipid metabolism